MTLSKKSNLCQECGKPLKWFNLLLHEKCWNIVTSNIRGKM